MFKVPRRGLERPALRVPRGEAERVRRRLLTLGALDHRYKPFEEEGWVYFPLKPEEVEEARRLGLELTLREFEPRKPKPRSLREALEDAIPPDLLDLVPSSYDLVGSVAVLELPEELEPYAAAVGGALMRLHPRVETVAAKVGGTRGAYRLRELRVIAGSGRTETLHREHGCVYKVDLRKAFFNPRMGGERLRVARQVKPGERVADMFAGVGPFSILIARTQPEARVLAVELNPDAHRYLVENVKLNGVEGRVEVRLGDVREVLKGVRDEFDRAIMDLPRQSLSYLDLAFDICRKGAKIHVYWTEDGVEKAVERVLMEVERLGRRASVAFAREIMEVAPRRFTVALDLVKDA